MDRTQRPRLAVVTEAFLDRSLTDLLDWLAASAPAITGVELGSGGYAPNPHCDREALLADPQARARFTGELEGRGFSVAALNAWGNPLHPDPEVGHAHERALRETILLAAELGVDRVVALAGAPAAVVGDRAPYFAAGGWLPYLEDVYERQWADAVGPFWSSISEFAARVHPSVRICLELHPGTAAFNVPTFSRVRAESGATCAQTSTPATSSGSTWTPRPRSSAHSATRSPTPTPRTSCSTSGRGHERAARPPLAARHRVAVAVCDRGDGHDAEWWSEFVAWLGATSVGAIAIEHEDPRIPAETGVVAAARILGEALSRAYRLRAYLIGFANAPASALATPTRLPSATWPSSRCSPHSAVGAACGFWAPPSGAIISTLAPPADEQRPL